MKVASGAALFQSIDAVSQFQIWYSVRFASEVPIGDPPTHDLIDHKQEAPEVSKFALVESEALLIGIGLQVEWLDGHVGPFQRSLE
jgi:hypothetical protein